MALVRDPDSGELYEVPDFAGSGSSTQIPYAPPSGTPGVDANPNPYNPYASPNDLGGYTGAPPTDTGTGLPQQGWAQDPNSQLWNFTDPNKPGGQPPPVAPMPGGGSSGSGGYGSPGSFDVSGSWPQFHAPDLPNINPFSFSYDSFHAPTGAEAAAEPGYAFARDEGIHALENAKSATGTLRTGGTLKDILGWGDKFAEQNYGNVYNRAANTYSLNRNNAYDVAKTTYGLNTGTSLDLYDRNFQGKLAEFNPKFSAAQSTFDDIYRRQRDLLDSLTKISTAGAGV